MCVPPSFPLCVRPFSVRWCFGGEGDGAESDERPLKKGKQNVAIANYHRGTGIDGGGEEGEEATGMRSLGAGTGRGGTDTDRGGSGRACLFEGGWTDGGEDIDKTTKRFLAFCPVFGKKRKISERIAVA